MSGEKMQKEQKSKTYLLSNIALNFFLPEQEGINWNIATALAFDSSPNIQLKDRDYIIGFYKQALSIIEPRIQDITAFRALGPTKIVVCDRHTWIINTTDFIKELFDEIFMPIWRLLEKPQSSRFARKTSQTLITSELGLLLGFISQKVLGQYDVRLHPKQTDDALFIVEPNIMAREKTLGVENSPLRLWILAHELTHRFQFHNYKWLREYYFGLIKEVAQIVRKKLEQNQNITLGTLSMLIDKENRELLAKIQSMMSFIEGHADYIMHKIGLLLPDYDKLKPIFEHRSSDDTTFVKRLFEKFIGLDIKINQYKRGFAFVREIDDLQGLSVLNKIDSPEKLPTAAEIISPQEWLKRMG